MDSNARKNFDMAYPFTYSIDTLSWLFEVFQEV